MIAVAVGVVAVFVVLLGASAVSTVLYFRAEAARVVAADERDAARAVTEYLTTTLASVQPEVAQGREVTVREVMDASAATS